MKKPSRPSSVVEDRPLKECERTLITWLIEHGEPGAANLQPSLKSARVARKCGCGCASIDLSIDGKEADRSAGIDVVSDYVWRSERGNLCGCFLFSVGDQLAGLDVWSVDGAEIPRELPDPSELIPIAKANDV